MFNRKYYEMDSREWDAAILEIEKKTYSREEAKELYKEGKIKEGEIISIKGASTHAGPVVMFAVFMSGKFVFCHAPSVAINIRVRKRKLVAHIMDQIEQGMIDTRQNQWLPARLQSPTNPDFVLYGSKSGESVRDVLGKAKSSHVPEILDKELLYNDLDDVKTDA